MPEPVKAPAVKSAFILNNLLASSSPAPALAASQSSMFGNINKSASSGFSFGGGAQPATPIKTFSFDSTKALSTPDSKKTIEIEKKMEEVKKTETKSTTLAPVIFFKVKRIINGF